MAQMRQEMILLRISHKNLYDNLKLKAQTETENILKKLLTWDNLTKMQASCPVANCLGTVSTEHTSSKPKCRKC